MNELKTPGRNLKRLRLSSGLTQAELGTKAGLSKDTISKLELGKQDNPGIKHLVSICRVLNADLEQLFIKDVNLVPINLIVSDASVQAIGRIFDQIPKIFKRR